MEDWNRLAVNDFDEVADALDMQNAESSFEMHLNIEQILNEDMAPAREEEAEDAPDRFNSVINFPNFLLHVLRVQTGLQSVALDDKRLIEIFEDVLPEKKEDRVKFVKVFGYNLLKCKFLFDKYIIKREFTANTDRWSLMALKWYKGGKVKNGARYTNTFFDPAGKEFESDNRRILMLLSMFHVSLPSMPYKYWITAALNFLLHEYEISGTRYIAYLEHIAKAFVFDKYLAKMPKDYHELIFMNSGPVTRSLHDLDLAKLNFGCLENNLIFNFLDYLIWLDLRDKETDARIKSFEFTFRSSVEHYYPQRPMSSDIIPMEELHLHSFGNLCLISHDKNSRLSNYGPVAKKDHYGKNVALDSLKQYLMMNYVDWSKHEIADHYDNMIRVFERHLNSGFKLHEETSVAARWFREYRQKDPALVVRAMLGFGDCAAHVNRSRYNLFDFEYIRSHEAYSRFEEYVERHKPSTLKSVVDSHLSKKELRNQYMILFIKYPEIIQYCKDGNFDYDEETDGRIIYLLEAEKRTTNKSRELYSFILQSHFHNCYRVQLYCDYESLYIAIIYKDGKYSITDNYREAHFNLAIWNHEGYSIDHSLIPLINGNAAPVQNLINFRWQKNAEGYFERFGRARLMPLGDDFEQNAIDAIQAVTMLLKNGLGIRMQGR
jgi:hypothetical protein